MSSSSAIIEEIQSAASDLQRKFLTLPGEGETISENQRKAVDLAEKGLLGWRSWELGELAKAFKVVS